MLPLCHKLAKHFNLISQMVKRLNPLISFRYKTDKKHQASTGHHSGIDHTSLQIKKKQPNLFFFCQRECGKVKKGSLHLPPPPPHLYSDFFVIFHGFSKVCLYADDQRTHRILRHTSFCEGSVRWELLSQRDEKIRINWTFRGR